MNKTVMSKLNQKVELVANVLIIVVAVLLGGVIVQKYFFNSPASGNEHALVQPKIGSRLNVSDVDLTAQPKTLILALQTTCRFCNESASFYKRLVEGTKDKNVKIVAVFPTSVEEATAHLNQLGVAGMEVKQAPISALETSGTPTLILTNQQGEVTNYWIGKLTPDREQEVINQINS